MQNLTIRCFFCEGHLSSWGRIWFVCFSDSRFCKLVSPVWILKSPTIHWADHRHHFPPVTEHTPSRPNLQAKLDTPYKQQAPGFSSAAFREESILQHTASMQMEVLQHDYRWDQKEAGQMVAARKWPLVTPAQKEHTSRLPWEMKLIDWENSNGKSS